MMTPDVVLVELRQMFHTGQFRQLIETAKILLPTSAAHPEVRLLLARALLEQGRFGDAALEFSNLEQQVPATASIASLARLWFGFTQIYQRSSWVKLIYVIEEVLGWTINLPEYSAVRALAYDLGGRVRAITDDWAVTLNCTLPDFQECMRRAAELYHKAGDTDRALGITILAGRRTTNRSRPDHFARHLLERSCAEALRSANLVRLGEAMLGLAEIDLQEQLVQYHQPDISGIELRQFQAAANTYTAAGHALGSADVWLSLSQRLAERGFDTREWLQHALDIYIQEENLSGIHAVLRVKSVWYLRQGQLDDAYRLHQETAKLADQMAFNLGQTTAAMGIGDYHFRVGAYAAAIAAYEQARNLAVQPMVQGLIELNLTSTYTLMNQLDQAEEVGQAAVKQFRSVEAASNLSLALYILGNVYAKQAAWDRALAVWREGLVLDEQLANHVAQAEKLIAIGQATVMQYYRGTQATIPIAAYQEAIQYYEAAVIRLGNIHDPVATAVRANAFQLHGQSALSVGQIDDAIHFLEQAATIYTALGLGMQTATTHTIIGLLYYDIANKGKSELYTLAIKYYAAALEYYEQIQMRDISWRLRYYLALTLFRLGVLNVNQSATHDQWAMIKAQLDAAAADIDLVRGAFVERDPLTTDLARLGLMVDKQQFYNFAINFFWRYQGDARNALEWIERMKGRAFLDILAEGSLPVPAISDSVMRQQEQIFLDQRRQAHDQAAVVQASEALRKFWTALATYEATAEYAAMRLGKPIGWAGLQRLLKNQREHNHDI